MTAALVPVKRLEAGKSRLEAGLGREATARLMEEMLEDVLQALRGVPRLDPVAVVTPDPALAELARKAGAQALPGRDLGLNASLMRAALELTSPAAPDLLVVLGDVAGAAPNDLEALLERGEQLGHRSVVLAPSSDGGTSALLRRPHNVIRARFGPQSAARHHAEAKRAGVPCAELSLPSLALDLDCTADLERFLARGGAGWRTRALLRELGLGARA